MSDCVSHWEVYCVWRIELFTLSSLLSASSRHTLSWSLFRVKFSRTSSTTWSLSSISQGAPHRGKRAHARLPACLPHGKARVHLPSTSKSVHSLSGESSRGMACSCCGPSELSSGGCPAGDASAPSPPAAAQPSGLVSLTSPLGSCTSGAFSSSSLTDSSGCSANCSSLSDSSSSIPEAAATSPSAPPLGTAAVSAAASAALHSTAAKLPVAAAVPPSAVALTVSAGSATATTAASAVGSAAAAASAWAVGLAATAATASLTSPPQGGAGTSSLLPSGKGKPSRRKASSPPLSSADLAARRWVEAS
mmetsp:Transcript_15805/g.49682  ORF Transcript_15805/g.49682 Transcript_15805/m.49682 type:complete len:306 (+) Transcript_15805:1108-2025(+)